MLPLSEIAELVIDYRGKTPKKLGGDWSVQGYRAISAKNVKTRQIVQSDSIRYLDESLYRKWMKEEIKRGDILITSEAPFGQLFYWDSDEKIVLSQRLFALRCKKEFYSPYIFHYMTSDAFQSDMECRATGTTVTGLRQPELLKCRISVPSFEKQKIIADTLSTIDAKIENNKRINHHLEQIAKAIFYEKFGNQVPNGLLGDLASVSSGKRPPIKVSERTATEDIPILGAASIMGYTSKSLYSEKILVTGRVGTHGIIQRYNRPCWPSDNALVLKSDDYELVYQNLLSIDFSSMNRGSTQPLITQTDLKNVAIYIPTQIELSDFEDTVGTIMQQYESNIVANESLVQLRDSLLPKLMSGEISVTD